MAPIGQGMFVISLSLSDLPSKNWEVYNDRTIVLRVPHIRNIIIKIILVHVEVGSISRNGTERNGTRGAISSSDDRGTDNSVFLLEYFLTLGNQASFPNSPCQVHMIL